jgi:hypothetical protein
MNSIKRDTGDPIHMRRKNAGKFLSDTELMSFYEEIVNQAENLASIKVRQNFYSPQIFRHLTSMKAIPLLSIFLFSLIIGFLILCNYPGEVAQVGTYASSSGIAWYLLLFGTAAFINDVYVRFFNPKQEDYEFAVSRAFNRFTLFRIPAALVVGIGALQIVLPSLVRIIIIIIWAAALLFFMLTQFTFSWRNYTDYKNSASVILGRRSAIATSTNDLVKELVKQIEKNNPSRNRIHSLLQLAENDLRHAEVRLATTNVVLAVGAMIVAILFSDQLSPLFIHATEILKIGIGSFGEALASTLALTTQYSKIIDAILKIDIWWLLINLFLSWFYFLCLQILNSYYSRYRPSYAILRALLFTSEITLPR